jgi:hypothetical protein
MAAALQARSQELDEQHEATRQRASWQETEQTRLDDQAAELQMRIATSEEDQSQWRNACALRDAAAAERELRVAAELDEQRLELSRHAADAQTVVRSGIEVLLAFRQAAETRVRDQEAAEANAARLGARIDELCRQKEEA